MLVPHDPNQETVIRVNLEWEAMLSLHGYIQKRRSPVTRKAVTAPMHGPQQWFYGHGEYIP